MLTPGDTFGRLTVLPTPPQIVLTGSRQIARRKYQCKCECGTIGWYREYNLKNPNTTSCGCRQSETSAEHRQAITTHGLRSHPLYHTWKNMIRRCYGKSDKRYKDYGARGVIVCAAWHNIAAFIDWATANSWQPGLELDREHNDGNYEPGNCRWVTDIEQANNKRNNHLLTACGTTQTMSKWAKDPRCTVSYHTLQSRKQRGWDDERAILEPKRVNQY